MSDEVPTRKETPEVDSTDRVARLGRHAFDKSGNLKSFSDQLTAYALGETPNNEYLILSEDSSAFGLPTDPSLPMIISQANIRKISFDHEISLGMLANLDEWLKNHPLSMDSITRPDALVVFAGAKDGKDNEIVIALSIERQSGQKGFEVSVDEVASVYGKRDLDFFIGNTARLGKRLFVNERTKDWLSRTGVQFPELATSPVYSEYTLSRVKSLDEVKAPTDPNAVRKVSSLTEAINLVGDEEFSKIVYGCVENPSSGFDYDAKTGVLPIDFDLYLDYHELDSLQSQLRTHLQDMYWGHASSYVQDGEELRFQAIDWLESEIMDASYDYYSDCTQATVDSLCDKLLETPGPWGKGIDLSDVSPVELAEDLKGSYGLGLETHSYEIVDGCSYPTTLLLDTQPDKSLDMTFSRHVLDIALSHMAAVGAGHFDPAAYGLAGDLARSSIEWLCNTQGTTLADVLNGQEGPFAESLREELGECGALEGGWPHLAVMCDLTAGQYFDALAASLGDYSAKGLVVRAADDLDLGGHTGIGFYDPVNGSCGLMGIRLERDLAIDAAHIGHAMPDYDQIRYGGWHTLQDCCGFTREAFSRTLADAPTDGRGEPGGGDVPGIGNPSLWAQAADASALAAQAEPEAADERSQGGVR